MMTAKELSKLITTGRKLKKFIKETLPKIREEFQSHSNSGIDKHTDGFGRRESIQSMNISNLCYSSFSGSYGSGDTYSDIANMDTDLMQEYFIKYLNRHKDEIMEGVADLMINDENRSRRCYKEIDEYKKHAKTIGGIKNRKK